MGKCSYPGCEESGLLFTCKLCGQKYCGKHRLPEMHECAYLDYFKSEEYRKMKVQYVETPQKQIGTRNMNENKRTIVLTKAPAQESFLPTKPANILALFSFGSLKKDLLVGVILAMLTMEVITSSLEQIIFYSNILGFMYSFLITAALGAVIVYTRYYIAKTVYQSAGGDIIVGHTMLNILATVLTNILPLFFRWISFGLFIPYPEPMFKKKAVRGIIGLYSFSTGLAFLFLVIAQAFRLAQSYLNPVFTPYTLITATSLYYGGTAILIYNIIMIIPFGYTEGSILLNYNVRLYFFILSVVIFSYLIYITPYFLTLGVPIILAVLGLSWGLFETLLKTEV